MERKFRVKISRNITSRGCPLFRNSGNYIRHWKFREHLNRPLFIQPFLKNSGLHFMEIPVANGTAAGSPGALFLS